MSRDEDFRRNLKTLDKIAALEDNWNDYGADPFDPELIDNARAMLRVLKKQPEIYPLADGGLCFQYGSREHGRMYIQIRNTALVDVYQSFPNGIRKKYVINCAPNDINEMVESFYE